MNSKRLISMTRANLKMTFRARQALFWNLAFPLVLLTLLSLVIGHGSNINATISVVGNGPVARQAETALKSISGVTIKIEDQDKALKELKDGNRDAVLVIPAGMPSSLRPIHAAMYYDQTNLSQSNAVVALLNGMVGELNKAYTHTPDALVLTQQGIASQSNNYIDFLVPGIIGMAVMTSSIIGTSSRMVGWREQRILKRLRATPLTSMEFVASNVISQLVVILAQVLVLTGAAKFIFGVHVAGNIGIAIGLAFLGGLAFLTIGFAISGLAKTTDAAGAIANIVTMPMMFLSGVYFPVSGAPDFLKPLIAILPLTYLANGLRDIMLHNTLANLGGDIAALCITAVVGIAVATRTFKWE